MKPDRWSVWWQGLMAGLIGYATIAIAFAIVNLLGGRSPFYTAALLGGALFYGVRDLHVVEVWPGAVLAYNGLHLVVFLVLGVFASWLAKLAEKGPHLWYVGVIFFMFVAFHLLGAVFMLAEPLRAALPAWLMVTAGFAASAAMAGYLVWTHPGVRAEMTDFAAQDADLIDLPR